MLAVDQETDRRFCRVPERADYKGAIIQELNEAASMGTHVINTVSSKPRILIWLGASGRVVDDGIVTSVSASGWGGLTEDRIKHPAKTERAR